MIQKIYNLSVTEWFDSDDYCYRVVYKYPDYKIAAFSRIRPDVFEDKLQEIVIEMEDEIEKAIRGKREFDTEDFHFVTIPENKDWIIRVYMR